MNKLNSMNEINNFQELRSEEVQELLGKVPAWILRWGTTVVFVILLLLFTGSYYLRYPDLVKASFKLTSGNAPKTIVAHSDGKVVQLFTKERQEVKAGTVLAYLESTAKHEDVMKLSKNLDKAWLVSCKGNLDKLNTIQLSDYHNLGEIQNDYQIFEQIHIKLKAYLRDGFYSKKKKMLLQEINDLQSLAQNLKQQQKIQEQEIRVGQEDYDIQKVLAREKVISPLDLKREEMKNIVRELPYQQTASAIINNLTAQHNKEKEILELDKQVSEERDQFLQSLNTLRSAVEAWKTRYVIDT